VILGFWLNGVMVRMFEALRAFEGLRPFEALRAFEGLRPFEALCAFEGLRPFEALRAFEGLRPFEALRAFEGLRPFEALCALEGLRPFEALRAFDGRECSPGWAKFRPHISAAGKKLFSLGHTHIPNTQNFFSTSPLFPFSTMMGRHGWEAVAGLCELTAPN
jgi:hypothetical protein